MSDDGSSPRGRFAHDDLVELTGEAAGQRVPEEPRPPSVPGEPFGRLPSEATDTYYDRPVIKEPVWIWSVPAYFFTGGAAGAAAALGAAAQLLGGERLRPLVRRCRWIASGGTAVGTAFLIHDLGRPKRFMNMLRVFRPTSPMSVGSWILASSSGASLGAAVLTDRGRPLGDIAGLAAGALGLPLAGYTAMLVSNSAVPVWQQTRRSLPHLFVASAASAAASLLELTELDEPQARVVERFGRAGKTAELAAAAAVEREAAAVAEVARPLHEGVSGAAWRAAKAMTATSLFLSGLPGGSPRRRRIGALLGIAGGVLIRFAVFWAGTASARDPRASFRQQRAGLGGRQATGTAAVAGPGEERAV